VKVVTLKDLWGIFLHRLWVILLVTVIAVATVLTSTSLTYEPRYNSSATLYILQQNQVKPNMEYEDFNLALKVVNDCTHLIKSHSVLDTVIKKLELDIKYEELYDSIKITNPPETRILEVVVESDSPQQAKRIVDEICVVGTERITEAMGFEQVHFFERGILNNTPCNRTSILVYAIIGFVAMILTYSVFLFIYFLDDKIRTDEDIKKYLNLSILGDIPNFNETKKKKYGNMYYRNKYYRRNTYGGNANE
jgi:capsular polysaccharide biosynthesis protein